MDPEMLMGASPAAPPMGAPMGAPPMGPMAPGSPPSPASAAMQALMGLAPQQDAAMQQMAVEAQDAVMMALQGAPNPLGVAAMSGPFPPGAELGAGAPADGALEGEDEVY